MYCPSPDVDPDSERGREMASEPSPLTETRILERMKGALAALKRAQARADKKRPVPRHPGGGAGIAHAVRLVSDDVPIAPDQLRDLKDGLTALCMFFTR
jgi:hypothetical protein